MDEPETLAAGYAPEIIWDGLGLIDYPIVPHFRSDHAEAASAERAASGFIESGLPFRTLRDGQVVVVQGSTARATRSDV